MPAQSGRSCLQRPARPITSGPRAADGPRQRPSRPTGFPDRPAPDLEPPDLLEISAASVESAPVPPLKEVESHDTQT